MYFCPVCNKGLKTEDAVRDHFLQCWKEVHPFHKSKSAPRGEDIMTRENNEDIVNFLGGLANGRN